MAAANWGLNYLAGVESRRRGAEAPARLQGLEQENEMRGLEIQEKRSTRDRQSDFDSGFADIFGRYSRQQPSGAGLSLQGSDSRDEGEPGLSTRSKVTLEQVAADPDAGNIFKNPKALEEMAQLAIKTRNPSTVKWLEARYKAEQEGTLDAAKYLARGDVPTALAVFNARGNIRATNATPADKSGKSWNVQLADGRTIQFDTEREIAAASSPAEFLKLQEARTKQAFEERKQAGVEADRESQTSLRTAQTEGVRANTRYTETARTQLAEAMADAARTRAANPRGGRAPTKDDDDRVKMGVQIINRYFGISEFEGLKPDVQPKYSAVVTRAGALTRSGMDPEAAANQAVLEYGDGRLDPQGNVRSGAPTAPGLRPGEASGRIGGGEARPLPRLW